MNTRLSATAWAELPHIAEVPALNSGDSAVLEEIRSVLAKHGALDRFGVCLIHRHFDLQEGEIVLETTEAESRRQVLEVRKAEDVLGRGNVIETQWVFDGSAQGVNCRAYCHYQDYGHRSRHGS